MLACLKLKIPKVNADLSNFVSSMINLEVYLSELKLNHSIDILAENSGRELIRALLHENLPGDILDRYQTITGKEYPTLVEFIEKAQLVANRISQRNKNKLKEDSSNNPKLGAPAITSTLPSSISNVNSHTKFKKKLCIFCGETHHSSSRCTKYTTVKARVAQIKKL